MANRTALKGYFYIGITQIRVKPSLPRCKYPWIHQRVKKKRSWQYREVYLMVSSLELATWRHKHKDIKKKITVDLVSLCSRAIRKIAKVTTLVASHADVLGGTRDGAQRTFAWEATSSETQGQSISSLWGSLLSGVVTFGEQNRYIKLVQLSSFSQIKDGTRKNNC